MQGTWIRNRWHEERADDSVEFVVKPGCTLSADPVACFAPRRRD